MTWQSEALHRVLCLHCRLPAQLHVHQEQPRAHGTMRRRGRGSTDPSFTLSCRTQHFSHRQHSQGEPLLQGSPATADKITLSFFRSFSLF